MLVPYLQENSEGAPVKMLLDEFSAHWTEKSKAKFHGLGIEVFKIPGGLTGFMQPIDVGIGKPLKDRIRRKWWDWMVSGGTDRTIFEPPTRRLACTWVDESWQELPDNVVRNAWMKTGYEYFPEIEEGPQEEEV